MKRIGTIILALAVMLSACTTPQGAVPPDGGIQTHVAGWNLSNQDPQVAEVLMNNNDIAGSRSAFQSYLNNGGKVDLNFVCVDGRVNTGSLFYAGRIAAGGVPAYYFEIGSLAAQVTPEILTLANKLIDKGWIRSINVLTHASDLSGCGAQSVKAELEAGKTLAEFESHGVGEAASWISTGVDHSGTLEQTIAQVSKLAAGTNFRVPVFGWRVDHGTQVVDLVAESYTGALGEDMIRDELIALNRDSAAIMGPQAQAEGLGLAQHFRHIVVVQMETPPTAELVAGLPEGKLDNVFNINVVVSPWANETEIQAALAGPKAALQYSLEHATEETEVLFFFENGDLLNRFLKEIEGWQVWQDFLGNVKFQEVAAYLVDKTGTITGSLLVKPAYTAVSTAMTIGPNFRNNHVSQVFEHQGRQWAVIHGGDPLSENSVLVTVEAPGVYRFARVFTKYEDAQFWLNGNLAGEPQLDGLFSIAKFGNSGGIVYSPDFGEDVFVYLAKTGEWSRLPEIMQQAEQYLLMKADAGFASTDIYHKDNILMSDEYGIHVVDWSPIHTLTGAQLLSKFGSPAAYQLYVQRDLGDMARIEANLSDNLGLGYPIRQHLPIPWSAPASSSFYFEGSQLTIAGEQAVAFERALVNLGSTSPEMVMEGRNWLAANGATWQNGNWVIWGPRSNMASGIPSLTMLSTNFHNGGISFWGINSSRLGPIGFQVAENIPGVAGWTVYAPGLNEFGVSLAKLGEKLGKASVYVWAGYAAYNAKSYWTQTDYIAAFSPQVLLEPPTTTTAYIWFPNNKTTHPVTRWEIPLAELQNGCNGAGLTADGCGAYLPDGQRSPIAIVGALAGEYLPQTFFPYFGLDGNNVLQTWEYMREGSSFWVWHSGLPLNPGETLDYYETVITQDGIWQVPYHAELQTSTCAGFCLQQVHGGVEWRALEGAVPTEIDLCPVDYATGSDPCLWRP